MRVTRDTRAAVAGDRDVARLRRHAVGAERQPGPVGDAASRARIGSGAAREAAPHVFVFRSTLVPGTVEDVLRPHPRDRVRQEATAVDFHVCFQPEFLREGSSIRDYDKPPFTIVGANGDAAAIKLLRSLFGHLPCEFPATSVRAAEMVKYCCNNFHALKITFANETARLCEALGVDPFEVMDLVCQDRSSTSRRPISGRASRSAARACRRTCARRTTSRRCTTSSCRCTAASWRRTARTSTIAIEKVMATGKRRIGMIGLSFKTGTDDLRESPLVPLAEHFIGKGLSLLVYDPEVHLSSLLGANRRFIEQHVPHIAQADPWRHRRRRRGIRCAGRGAERPAGVRSIDAACSPRPRYSRSCEHSRRQGIARAACRVVLVTHG